MLYCDTTPRVRGLLIAIEIKATTVRYNPACAGTTGMPRVRACAASIQPRVCGDYRNAPSSCLCRFDTPPRVRGLPAASLAAALVARYNPACAGTTCSLTGLCISFTIQPRVCGDYQQASVMPTAPLDTTPRVRGLRGFCSRSAFSRRYNPACAGTTHWSH